MSDHAQKQDYPDDVISLITLAACILMGFDQKLSPQDAVGDALQVYGCVREHISSGAFH